MNIKEKGNSVIKLNIVVLLLFSFSFAYAQNETSNWIFSPKNHLIWDHILDSSKTIRDIPIDSATSTSAISDENGKLLIYTDGRNIYGADNKVITNGHLRDKIVYNPQHNVIVPAGSGNKRIYYVITSDATVEVNGRPTFPYDTVITYSTVCKNRNGNFFGRDKNVVFARSTIGAVSAVKHSNNRDTWLGSVDAPKFRNGHVVDTITLRMTLFSECGIVNQVVNKIQHDSSYAFYGATPRIKFSPDGQHLLLIPEQGVNFLTFLSFNNSTGEINTSPKDLYTYGGANGAVLFSRDSRFLYFGQTNLPRLDSIFIVKFDIDNFKKVDSVLYYQNSLYSVNYTASNNLVALQHVNGRIFTRSTPYFFYPFVEGYFYGGMDELKDDTKLSINYWTMTPYLYLSKIYFPTDITSYPVYFPSVHRDRTFYAMGNLTNFVESYFDINYISQSSIVVPKANRVCVGDTSIFEAVGTEGVTEHTWYFGDGSLSKQANSKHLYKKAGQYNANLIVKYSCSFDTIPFTVFIDEQPTVNIAEEHYVCGSRSVTVKGPPGYTSYKWQDGSTDSVFVASESTTVTLTVTNSCGSASSSSEIRKTEITGPNVFTPNGDGINDYLIFDNPFQGVPELKIYNRWGKEVFKDDTYQNNWNGGNLVPAIYYYELSYPGCDVFKSWLQIFK